MKKILMISLFFVFALIQCSSNDTKEKINKVGNVTGQAVGELVSGISSGVKKAFDVKIDLPERLADKGVRFGKTTVTSDSSGNDNLLIIYIIFNNDFKSELTVKAFDSKGLEMGRARIIVEGKKDEAKYFDFHFDKRTKIDFDSKLTIE